MNDKHISLTFSIGTGVLLSSFLLAGRAPAGAPAPGHAYLQNTRPPALGSVVSSEGILLQANDLRPGTPVLVFALTEPELGSLRDPNGEGLKSLLRTGFVVGYGKAEEDGSYGEFIQPGEVSGFLYLAAWTEDDHQGLSFLVGVPVNAASPGGSSQSFTTQNGSAGGALSCPPLVVPPPTSSTFGDDVDLTASGFDFPGPWGDSSTTLCGAPLPLIGCGTGQGLSSIAVATIRNLGPDALRRGRLVVAWEEVVRGFQIIQYFSFRHRGLDPGASIVVCRTYYLGPQCLMGVPHRFSVKVDPNDLIPETDEGNNADGPHFFCAG